MGNAILRRSKRACALCNALDRHDYPNEPYDTYEGSCTSEGWVDYVCTRCNNLETIWTGYNTSNHEAIGYSGDGSSSTCIRHGDREVHCDACGEWWSEELPLDPDNHEDWVGGGYQVEGHCEACGAVCDHEFYTDPEGYGRCSKCGYYDY